MTTLEYSIIQTPLNKWAVIRPQDEVRSYHTGRVWFPQWLPTGMTHVGIYNTLDEAVVRMNNLRNEVK